MTREEEEELLRLARENNQMLREIVFEMRKYLDPENVNKRNVEDFIRGVNANLYADDLKNRYRL